VNQEDIRSCRSARRPWAAAGLALLLPGLAAAAELPEALPRLAYIDPGTGSMIIQILVATFAGALIATRTYWSKIKQFLGGARNAAEEEGSVDPTPGDE
jgi:hypothetical protein